jgi:hypothetical protein
MLNFDVICEDVFLSNLFLILSEGLKQSDKIQIYNIALRAKAIKLDTSLNIEQKKDLYLQLREELKGIYLRALHLGSDRNRVLSNIERYIDSNINNLRDAQSSYKMTPETAKYLKYLLSTNL